MALTGMKTDSSSFSSSSSVARRKYDVFLSFRGEDTRHKFMGHLYEALIQKGIVTFKDDEKLERGKSISLELLKAIEESEFAVVILSKNYASSTWCLDELAKIIRCKNEMGMTVLPVFHYVKPSDVRKQMETFAQAFAKHEQMENKERVEKWRDALTQVGSLRGWHLKSYWSEIEDIKDIVGWISLHLKYDALPYITKDLVGIYSQMMELESCLALRSNDVRFIGIWGMGGIGKTTLARVVYYMVSKQFEGCSFIKDVRENVGKHGLVPLQQKIIDEILMVTNLKIKEEYDGALTMKKLCDKRILLVLDDINELYQLKMLAGEHDWFGSGSRIIITTRDAHVLEAHGVDEIYDVKGLNNKDAFQLFSSKAFKEKHVPYDYLELTNHFLNYANCLPLALEVLGSFLFGKSIVEWKIALQRLKKFPEEAILRVLEISLNGLQKSQKEIFLYIACFFNHQGKDYVVEKLDILGLYPGIGLRELVDKSLLKMDDRMVWMHDLLAEMGRNIVCQECPSDPGKRSRLWHYEDIDKVFKKNKGTKEVQAMDIWNTYNEEKRACWNPEAFLKMCNIKLLRIRGTDLVPTHLPDDLKILEWIKCPLKSLPSSFEQDELIQICLQDSKIEQLWIGRKNFDKLKFMTLTNCSNLTITPDFTGVPNLQRLVLEYCSNLCELHPSIGMLKKLVYLSLQHCKKLNSLPSEFEMNSLMTLNLSCCLILEKIPKFVGNMECLQKLFLDSTSIMELPSSVGGLIGLTSLTLSNCKNLVCLPNTICSLKSLEFLDLCGCLKFDNLPENLGNVESLKELDLRGTAIQELPTSIECLKSLTSLTILQCRNLVCLPNTICGFKFHGVLDLSGDSKFTNLPENLWIIEGVEILDLSRTAIEELPSSIECLTSLTLLILKDCKNFVRLPDTICSLKSLESLNLSGCSKFDHLPENLGNVEGLKKLDLSETAITKLPSSIERLTNLTSLTLCYCYKLECLPSTTCGLKLRGALDLSTCFGFKNLPENLWLIDGLKMLDLSRTTIEELPSSIECLTSLTLVTLKDCKNLMCLPSTICRLKSLKSLDLSGCSKFDNLPENLGNVEGLKKLDLSETIVEELPSSIGCLTSLTLLTLKDCKNLVCLPSSICSLKSLESLDLSRCSKFDNLPEYLGNVEGLKELNLSETAIEALPSSIECLTSLTLLTLKSCKNLVHLPSTMCSLKSLKSLDLSGCSEFDNLPENLGNIEGLQELDLGGTAIEELYSSIEHLTSLVLLTLRDCKNLVCLPRTICSKKSLKSLDLSGCSKFDSLPKNIGNVEGLKKLDLSGSAIEELPLSIEHLTALSLLTLKDCKNLVCLPSAICSMKSLESLDLSGCSKFDNLPENLGNAEGLKELDLSGTALKELPSSIERLTSLTLLTLKNCKNLVCLPDTFCSLKLLQSLDLSGCSIFDNLPENLGNVEGLKNLDLSGTTIIELPSSIERLTSLTSLTLLYCCKLECLPNTTCGLKLCGALDLSTCFRFKYLPENLWIIEGLEMLDLSRTAIEELPLSIERLANLTLLSLRYCINLVSLPNTICSLKFLNSLDLFGSLKFEKLPENIGNMESLELLNLSWTAIKEVPSSIALLKNLEQLHIRGWKLSEFYSWPASLELMGPLQTSLFSLPTSPTMERILLPSFLYCSLPTCPFPMGLLLHSLAGLQSLTHLHLSECDLSSIPNDIGCLSSLEHLDLSGNNFVSLPESISQLSNLQRLLLEGCKRLLSLVNVPSTTDYVIANNCSSLERLPKLQNYHFETTVVPHLKGFSHLRFQCVNCFKLVDNFQTSSIIHQGQSGRLPDILDIIIPGGEIPKGFSHERTGHELNIRVPSLGFNDLMGIVLCVVFASNKLYQNPRDCQLSCLFKVRGDSLACPVYSNFTTKYGKVELPHLWLLYFSSHYFSLCFRGKRFCHIDAIEIRNKNLEVVKIGVHLVYKQDIENPSRSMTQCSSNCSALNESGVFSIMILMIQLQKVAQISEAVMRMMGLDLVEKATLMTNHRQRGFMKISIQLCSNNSGTLYEGLGEIYRDIEQFSRRR